MIAAAGPPSFQQQLPDWQCPGCAYWAMCSCSLTCRQPLEELSFKVVVWLVVLRRALEDAQHPAAPQATTSLVPVGACQWHGTAESSTDAGSDATVSIGSPCGAPAVSSLKASEGQSAEGAASHGIGTSDMALGFIVASSFGD